MNGIQEMAMKGVIVHVHGRNTSNLKFADDIVLSDESYERLQNKLQKLDKDSRIYGMRITIDKTKTMMFSKQSMQQVGNTSFIT